jgi:hypothetical protein
MGHAYCRNISEFWNRRLYAKGKLSIRECILALEKAGEAFNTAEAAYSDKNMLGFGLFLVIAHLTEHKSAVIEPSDMSDRQKVVYEEWLNEGCDRFGCYEWDDLDCKWGIFESIKWRYAPGWRKQYPEIPVLGHLTC